MVSDAQGRLWVESTRPGGTTLSLFAADGMFLGETTMPARDPAVAVFVRGNHLHIVTIDNLDVQSIQLYEAEIR